MYDTADCVDNSDSTCTTTFTMLDVPNGLALKWQAMLMNASDAADPCYGCFK